jgi:hypothetical protein
MKPIDSKPKVPRGRRGKKADSDHTNPANADEFERAGMGVAPKE